MQSESPLMPLFWILLVFAAGTCVMLFSPYLFSTILIGFAILAGAAAVGVTAYVVYWIARNKLSPVRHVRSRVIRRRKKDWDVSLVGDSQMSAMARLGLMGRDHAAARKAWSRAMARDDIPELELIAGTNYFVTFDVNDQEEEFCVPECDYIRCSEGAEGLLVFQGEQFKHFMLNTG